MGRATPTTDILPECLIQKIFSYLSFKEAAKKSILSKTWLHAWLTLPNLEFTVDYLKDNTKIVDNIMERYRDGKIPIEKFELSDYSDSIEVFVLIDKWLDIALQNGVKDLVYRDFSCSSSYRCPIFTILAAKSLRDLVLWCCNLKLVSFTSSVANCNSLRKLSLIAVHLDENMLQTLLSSCPLIVSFILEYCDGLEKIELLNLQKIKSVSIRTQQNRLVKIQAPTLENLTYSSYSSEEFDVVECQNLKSLDISHVTISDGFLQNLISRSQSLKMLKLQYCHGTGDIDSSNLVSLEYMGDQIPELKIASDSRKLKHSKIVLHCYSLNVAWFCKLRKFLSDSTSWSQVSLYVVSFNEINMKDMRLDDRVPIPQVDVLDVEIESSRECPMFVDALLGSCHPRRLILTSTNKMIKHFISHFMYMKNLSDSTSYGNKPWHGQLKEVKAYIFDRKNSSWQVVELRRVKLAIMTLSRSQKVQFPAETKTLGDFFPSVLALGNRVTWTTETLSTFF
ncbi:FBD-associated F-box protein At3g52670-like [Lycium ferocissimum]|uniref:FBD-associated F-box protein At3g52670-like n=1 Tax=Lycium ferocissimum TaxID=112874 RepID=UPI0028166850|nr:FBD-associated F-box protein At3g52670-like [Lycium ferocissimum]